MVAQDNSPHGKPWTEPAQYNDTTGKLILLPSNIALFTNSKFKQYVQLYSNNEQRFLLYFLLQPLGTYWNSDTIIPTRHGIYSGNYIIPIVDL